MDMTYHCYPAATAAPHLLKSTYRSSSVCFPFHHPVGRSATVCVEQTEEILSRTIYSPSAEIRCYSRERGPQPGEMSTHLSRCPSIRITPSKRNDTDGIGRASPGPGRKCRLRAGARGGDLYACSSGLTCTVTSTRKDSVVCGAHPSAHHSRPAHNAAYTPGSRSSSRPAPTPPTDSRRARRGRCWCARGARALRTAGRRVSVPVGSFRGGRGRTLSRQMDRLVRVRAQKSVLRGLETRAMTCSAGTGSGGAEESCRAADVGKYIGSCAVVSV